MRTTELIPNMVTTSVLYRSEKTAKFPVSAHCYLTALVKKKICFVFAGTLIVLGGVVGRTEQLYCLKGWQQVDYMRKASLVDRRSLV
jgi:hypothetical protein